MKALALRALGGLGLVLAAFTAFAGQVTYYHNDLAGSPVAATNASGQVIWRESYRPYGERLTNAPASSGNKVWFTSRRQDAETGLVYMGARYYDPVVGRFTSVDLVSFVEGNVHSFNRYAYANNNPYKYTDPDGRSARVLWAVGELSFSLATRPGARELGSAIAGGLWVLLNEGGDSAKDAKNGEASNSGEGQKDVTKRPSRVRKGTEQGNWEDAEDGERGGKLCPTCGNEVTSKPGDKNKDWDNDHNPAWRDRDLTGKDRKGVLDEYNRDTRLRCVGCNRSDNGN